MTEPITRKSIRSITKSKFYSISLLLFILLTVTTIVVTSCFYINSYLQIPQHGHLDNLMECKTYIEQHGKLMCYNLFFYIDFVWAVFFLIILLGIACFWKKPHTLLILIAVLAYGFDFIENMSYLNILDNIWISENLNKVVSLKLLAYGVCIFYAMKSLVDNYYSKVLYQAFKNSIKASWISIIVILLIFALLSFVGQGGTIIIHLLNSWWNLVIVMFLLNFLALLLSHYPSYFVKWQGNQTINAWNMDQKNQILGIGDIFYIPLSNKSRKQLSYENMFKRSIGICLFLCWIYGLLIIYKNYFNPQLNASGIAMILSFSTLCWYFFFEKWKNNAKKLFGEEDMIGLYKDMDEKENKINHVRTIVNSYWILFTLSMIFTSVSIYYSATIGWSRSTIQLLMAASFFFMLLFIHFRVNRSLFKHFYGTSYKNKILSAFQEKAAEKRKTNPSFKWGKYLHWLGMLSHNLIFIKVIKYTGVVLFGLFIGLIIYAANDNNYNSFQMINPLVIIFYYLILFYSLISIALKIWKYYSQKEIFRGDNDRFQYYKKFYYKKFPYIMAIFIGIAFFASKQGNNLHELTLVKEGEVLNLKEYASNLFDTIAILDITKPQNYYTVNAYGGGLKSNLWTMLVLQNLQEKSNNQFLNNTISLSGVSGGAIGLSNYCAILKESSNQEEIKDKIDAIGRINTISLEIHNMFSADFIREMYPFENVGNKDRSYYSMRAHAEIVGMDIKNEYEKISFRTYWKKLYDKKGHFPALLLNTTSTAYYYGIAPSLKNTKHFPGSVNILDIQKNNEKLSLGYYGATSTTNRFPFLSPAARIEKKGHFLDGGYFENSGLLSTQSFANQLFNTNLNRNLSSKKIKHIVISNGKMNYIKHFVNDYKKLNNIKNLIKKVSATNEVGAILNALIDVQEIPNYFEEKDSNIYFINLPHKIEYNDIVSHLRGTPVNPLQLMDVIDQHNNNITQFLSNKNKNHNYDLSKWGLVETPLARLLSEPGMQYQKAMLQSVFVQKQIDDIWP